MLIWYNKTSYPPEIQQAFNSVDAILAIKLKAVSKSSKGKVIKYHLLGKNYYIKQYNNKGKGVKKYFGRSRLRREVASLHFCAQHQINTPKIVAYGEKYQFFGLWFKGGILITEEVPDTSDLAHIAKTHPDLLANKHWRRQIITQLATYLRILHQHKFIHHDLYWRNILVTQNLHNPQIYLFDMPSSKVNTYFFAHGVKRDFYCLYKNAKKFLSQSELLRFYLLYKQAHFLSSEHKKEIKEFMLYFKSKLSRA